MRRYCIRKMSPVVILIALLVVIIAPTTLQPSLATSNNNTTGDIPDNQFFKMTVTSNQSTSTVGDKTNVTLRGIFITVPNDQGSGNWNLMLQPALDELNRRHPEMNIQIEYAEPYGLDKRNSILDRLSNGDSVDIVSVDQIWLGEFAERGLIRNLTADFEQWGRMGDLYEGNLDGSVYNNTVYALLIWTDVRGM